MGIIGGPNIVEDGLVLYFDIANDKCYTVSASTLNDLSNYNNGVINGSPIYNSENLGGLYFNGSTDSVIIPFNPLTMDFSLAQTISMWIKPGDGADTTRRNPYNQAYGGSGTITHEPNGILNYFFGTHGGNATPYVGRGSNFTVEPNELAFITVTRSQELNTCKWYKNGLLYSTGNAGGYTETNNGNSHITIADGYTNKFIGNIYQIKIYNKYLTSDYILQNYNAIKGRFNL